MLQRPLLPFNLHELVNSFIFGLAEIPVKYSHHQYIFPNLLRIRDAVRILIIEVVTDVLVLQFIYVHLDIGHVVISVGSQVLVSHVLCINIQINVYGTGNRQFLVNVRIFIFISNHFLLRLRGNTARFLQQQLRLAQLIPDSVHSYLRCYREIFYATILASLGRILRLKYTSIVHLWKFNLFLSKWRYFLVP